MRLSSSWPKDHWILCAWYLVLCDSGPDYPIRLLTKHQGPQRRIVSTMALERHPFLEHSRIASCTDPHNSASFSWPLSQPLRSSRHEPSTFRHPVGQYVHCGQLLARNLCSFAQARLLQWPNFHLLGLVASQTRCRPRLGAFAFVAYPPCVKRRDHEERTRRV